MDLMSGENGEPIERQFYFGIKNISFSKVSVRRRKDIESYAPHLIRKLKKCILGIASRIRHTDDDSIERIIDKMHAICVLQHSPGEFENEVLDEFCLEYECGDYETEEEMRSIREVLKMFIVIFLENIEAEYTDEIIDFFKNNLTRIKEVEDAVDQLYRENQQNIALN